MRISTGLIALCLPLLVSCGGGTDPDPAEPGPQKGADNTPNTPPESRFELPLPREDAAAGWIALFDGESLFGWTPNNEVDWAVEDGSIVASEGEPGLLVSSVPFADFRFRCEFQLEKGGNSGVFLRSAFDPSNPATECYEFNLCDTHDSFVTGSLVGRKATKHAPTTEDGDWHRIEVHCEGPHVFGYVDGILVVEYFDEDTPDLRRGFVGLQKNAGRVAFRNVHLKPLGTEPLFDGESLDGWREVPGNEATFKVARNDYTTKKEDTGPLSSPVIRATGGPGFLETERTFGDFVLQLDARTLEPRVNSGVFFRAEEGTKDAPSNGYELQIHNGVKDGDREQPNDYGDGFGTGAVFRRQRARTVVSDDKRWTTITLVAVGNRFATWVDGYPVATFTDDRDTDSNPRKGRRDEAGHLSLQAHDAGTAIDFRNVDVAPYP